MESSCDKGAFCFDAARGVLPESAFGPEGHKRGAGIGKIPLLKGSLVLVLPAVELGAGETLETVVALQYRVEEKDNGLRSKFEIK